MKKIWKNTILCVLLTTCLLISGCQFNESQEDIEKESTEQCVEEIADVSAGHETLQTTVSANIRSQKQWEYINGLSTMLGKTAVEIVSETGAQVEYRWRENRSEVLALHNGGFDIECLLFQVPYGRTLHTAQAFLVRNCSPLKFPKI